MVTFIQTAIPPPCFVDMADVNIALSLLPGCRSELRKQSGRHPGIPWNLHYPALFISRQHVKYFFVSSFIRPFPCFSHFDNRWRMLMLHPRVFHISEKFRMRQKGRVSKHLIACYFQIPQRINFLQTTQEYCKISCKMV